MQGGLPLRLLGEARGGIGRLLARVLQLAGGREVARTELKGWVESLQSQLPKSYRKDIIYELLTEVILVALKLKQEANLSAGDDAVAVLDRKVPGWKDRFPVSMEDRHAQMLVEQLVRDVANVRIRKVKPCLPVERTLEQEEDGQWSLVSRIELPDTLDFSAIAQLFGIEDVSNLPRAATLVLIAGDEATSTTLRALAGRNAYRVEPAECAFADHAACEEHLLELSAPDGRSWRAEVSRGESLDEDLAWIFSAESPQELLKQGDGRIANGEVLLALPGGWQCETEEDSVCQAIGTIRPWHRTLFQLRGAATLKTPGGALSTLRTGQADTSDSRYIWNGNRIWLDFLQPRCAYKGKPRLYRLDDDGNRHPVQGRPACRVIGNPDASEAEGPVLLQYPSTGTPQIRTRMLLLPERSALDYRNVDANGGTIHFSNWGISRAQVVEPSFVQQAYTNNGDGVLLEVLVGNGVRTPEWLTLELLWPHTTKTARIKLPFPASGVRAFDGDGKELLAGQQIAADYLAGARLVMNRGAVPAEKLTLAIEAGLNHLSRRYPLRMLPGVLSVDIALIDYETDIQQLLSLDDSPDSEITLSISTSRNQQIFSIRVARYAAVIERDAGQLALNARSLAQFNLDQLSRLQVLVTRLEHPADDPIELEPVLSEGVPTGRWEFDPKLREPGSWLVYPSPDADIRFRPCVWSVDNEDNIDLLGDDDLLNATASPDQGQREEQIAGVIESMASNFQHASWKTVEQMARQFGHLPLATLDLWRMFAHSDQGVAALAFRLGDLPRNFYLRFGRELPLAWETLALSDWKQAMEQLGEQCRSSYPDAADLIFKEQLNKCLTALRAECGALSNLLGIAAAAVDEQENRELYLLREHVAFHAEQELFEGGKSKLMVLRRTHAHDEWPTGFGETLDQARNEPEIGKFLFTDPNGYRDGVINLPMIAAVAAVLDRSNEFFPTPESIHLLRTVKAFDIQWFADAYNLTVARYLVEGSCDV